MEYVILVLLIAILAFLALSYWRSQNNKPDTQGLVLLQNQLQELTRTMDTKLGEGAPERCRSL